MNNPDLFRMLYILSPFEVWEIAVLEDEDKHNEDEDSEIILPLTCILDAYANCLLEGYWDEREELHALIINYLRVKGNHAADLVEVRECGMKVMEVVRKVKEEKEELLEEGRKIEERQCRLLLSDSDSDEECGFGYDGEGEHGDEGWG